jgi:NADH:ubiquinone oxidoreductase subunit 6 (subunit J)
MVMIVGVVVILVGFMLMMGGGSDDPNVFNEEIYNFRRIRLAPTIVLIGLAIEVYAIMANPDKNKK